MVVCLSWVVYLRYFVVGGISVIVLFYVNHACVD